MRHPLWSCGFATLLVGCGNAAPMTDSNSLAVQNLEAANLVVENDITPTTAPPQPDHNYDERQGWTYYYVAAVSEDDQKRGVAVGKVFGFQYLGRNDSGQFIIASIADNGTVSYRAKCSVSCRIIDTDDGEKIAYSPTSIVGAAFQDAFRGKLKAPQWVKDQIAASQAVPSRSNDSASVPDQLSSDTEENVTNESVIAPSEPQPSPEATPSASDTPQT